MKRRTLEVPRALQSLPDVNVETVDIGRLKPVGQRADLITYMRELWSRRHFIWADARAKAFSANRDTLLGNVWLIGRPILDGLTYFLIFGVVLGTSKGVHNFIGFLLIGVFMFSFTGQALTGGATVMTGGKNLIRAFSFPRASIPLALIIRQAISVLPVLATMLVMIALIPPHAEITWRWLLFPFVFLLQAMFNTGLVFYAARITSAIPDLRMVLSLVSRFWMYGSGVMYSIERFITHPTVLEVLQLNPLYCVIELSRDLLLYGTTPDPRLWITLAMWAVVTMVLGFFYFWQAEEDYARE